MKMLFKLYLLGQLIALPFMVGALGGALGGGTEPSSSPQIQSAPHTQSIASADDLTALTNDQICDALTRGEDLSILDNYQQLRLVIADYDDELADDCLGSYRR